VKSIEEISATFEALEPSDGYRWQVAALVQGRLYLSRGSAGEYALFLEGARESFGSLPPLAGIDHSPNVIALPGDRQFPALRVASSDPVHGNRVMAHISYELASRLTQDPSVENATLVAQVGWVFPLLGGNEGLLTPEKQRGLVGECLLLRQLLVMARQTELSPSTALERWWGHASARRDFAASNIAIEVKTTGLNTRQHHISTLEQLEPESASEEVYVYSVGIKTDPTAQKKLPHFVADVEAQLVGHDGREDLEAIGRFRIQLASYGFDRRHEGYYLAAPGFLRPHLTPALYPERDLDRLRLTSFVGGSLPSMVASVSYVLDIRSEPLSDSEAVVVLRRLLTQPVAGQEGAQ